MTKKILFHLFITALFNISAFSQDFNIKKLDSFFDALSNNNQTMGSFAIAKNGKIIYNRSIGYSNINNDENIIASEKTAYHIGSVTKMFTATMLFQLIDEGKITLQTTLSNFFPQMPNAKTITIETLLNHRNGLYDYANDQKDSTWIMQPHSKEEIINVIASGKTKFLPNQGFEYDNSGYFLLANIIEKVTGKSYSKNLQQRICQKIDLKNTYSIFNKSSNNEANSFQFKNNSWEEITDVYYPNAMGAGDILSTPTDLIKFNEALLSHKLCSLKSLECMKTFENKFFGMGIMKMPFYERSGFGHGGDTYGTHTTLVTFLNDSLTFASCINGEVFPHNNISIGVLSIYYNKKYEIPTFKTIELASEELNKYTGEYSSSQLPLKIKIMQKGNDLVAQATGQDAFILKPVEKDKFNSAAEDINIEFHLDKKEFNLKQANKTFLFKKDK